MKRNLINKVIATLIMSTIIVTNFTCIKTSASENEIISYEKNKGNIEEISSKYRLMIPEIMTIYHDEDIVDSVIKEIERINDTIIRSYIISIRQVGNQTIASLTVQDAYGNSGTGTVYVSIVKRPVRPVITANDVVLILGDDFNPLDGVTASDEEDGDITYAIVVTSNNVNVNEVGDYSVSYEVVDSSGLMATKVINVTVKENSAPVINTTNVNIVFGDNFNPMDGVTANDEEDGNITSKIEIIENTVNTKKVGVYKVIYKVTDSRNISTTKERKVNILIDNKADWKSHWGKKEIQFAMENSWVNIDSKFRPDDAITRAEFVKIVNNAFGYKEKGSIKFNDVKSTAWYYNEVAIALKAGFITGKNENFRPDEAITREEVASILTTINDNKDTKMDKLDKYTDKEKISEWAKSSVEGAIEAGYMGKNSIIFRPKDNITRAESVVTLYRVQNN